MNFHGQLYKHLVERGRLESKSIVLAFASGSHLYGTTVEGVSDLDVAGVYVGRPEEELGLGNLQNAHVDSSTSTDEQRNTSEDMDVKAYSLRRWAALAMKGNPSVLDFLFVPDAIRDGGQFQEKTSRPGRNWQPGDWATVWDTDILPNRNLFLSSGLTSAFLGLADNQRRRMMGEGTGKHGVRKEKTEKFGYDTKAAMHMIRGLQECLEVLSTGCITFPNPQKYLLMEIRLGNFSLESVLGLYDFLRAEVQKAEKTSPLPPKCDRKAVEKLVSGAVLKHWRQRGWV